MGVWGFGRREKGVLGEGEKMGFVPFESEKEKKWGLRGFRGKEC